MNESRDAQLWSPGKLLLTGEYFVLDGALALAVPTQMGQSLKVSTVPANKRTFTWKAFHQGKLWLLANYDFTLSLSASNSPADAAFVQELLRTVENLNPKTFAEPLHYQFETNLEFPADFGLGSSATLISNLAEWAHVDAYTLNESLLGGSGYDIAIAQKKTPLLFQKKPLPESQAVSLAWPFKQNLLFIHQGKKQSSREGIAAYRTKIPDVELITEISEISQQAVSVRTLSDFSSLMIRHEEIISQFLNITSLAEGPLKDCPAFLKSLGAWGGDFFMTAKFPGYEEYFRSKGLETVFTWEQIIA